jgi:hypothetical protein
MGHKHTSLVTHKLSEPKIRTADITHAAASRRASSFRSHEQFGSPLLLSGVSDNAGGVKYVSTTLPPALEEERHFALIREVRLRSSRQKNN